MVIAAFLLLANRSGTGGSGEPTIFAVTPGSEAQGGVSPPQHEPISRGNWNGNVFTNRHLGLEFTRPHGWHTASQQEMEAAAALLASAVPSDSLLHQMLDEEGSFVDMFAINPATGANAGIAVERLASSHLSLTEAEYINIMTDMLQQMGMQAVRIPHTTIIGGYEWHEFRTSLPALNGNVYGRNFINIRGGHIRGISVNYSNASESGYDILAMFSNIRGGF